MPWGALWRGRVQELAAFSPGEGESFLQPFRPHRTHSTVWRLWRWGMVSPVGRPPLVLPVQRCCQWGRSVGARDGVGVGSGRGEGACPAVHGAGGGPSFFPFPVAVGLLESTPPTASFRLEWRPWAESTPTQWSAHQMIVCVVLRACVCEPGAVVVLVVAHLVPCVLSAQLFLPAGEKPPPQVPP
jgi:hypothetical protein